MFWAKKKLNSEEYESVAKKLTQHSEEIDTLKHMIDNINQDLRNWKIKVGKMKGKLPEEESEKDINDDGFNFLRKGLGMS